MNLVTFYHCKTMTREFCLLYFALLRFCLICVWFSLVEQLSDTVHSSVLSCIVFNQPWVHNLRRESIEATGLQLQQTILPVGSGDTEVMDGAPQDAEGFSLQSELRWVGIKTLHADHTYFFWAIAAGQNTAVNNWENNLLNYKCQRIKSHKDISDRFLRWEASL